MTNSLINHHHEKELFWCFKAYVSVYLRAAVNYKARRDDRAWRIKCSPIALS